MDRHHPTARSGGRSPRAATLLSVLLVAAACGTNVTPTGSPPGASPSPSPTVSASASMPTASSTPAPTDAPGTDRLQPGALAVTVSDRLRVRSLPEVSAASIKYRPLLPAGTSLVVTGGPVSASGYTWFRVLPIGVALDGGVDEGWVAAGDHDGTAWLALAPDPTPGYELASASVARPGDRLADARAEAAAVNAFGIALYRRMLADQDLHLGTSSVVISPTSIAIALAMARAGADGVTADEMDDVLGADGWKAMEAGVAALDQRLATRGGTWADDGGKTHGLALRMANTAFGQEGIAFEDAYLERVARATGAGLGLVDYMNDTPGARQAINGWVARNTANRIPELLTPTDLDAMTRLVLVNAIYLKAMWALPFDEDETTDRAFTRLDGSSGKVPTMELLGGQDVPYATGDGWRATELRYLGPDRPAPLAMTLILPDALGDFEQALTDDRLAGIVTRLDHERDRLDDVLYPESADGGECGTVPYEVRLLMPRFSVETRADLVPALRLLGMTTAVDRERADFSLITSDPSINRLYIQKVIHQANIDVDEAGTEASAATAVIMGDTTGGCADPIPLRRVTLRLDHPFLFAIRDVETGAVLFMGRVVDPSARS